MHKTAVFYTVFYATVFLTIMRTISGKRRGVSGLMQVAMIVGIVIIFSGVLFAFVGDIFDVQTITDSIALQKITIQHIGAETFVSVNAKNTGNNDVTSLQLQVMTDTDADASGVQPFTVPITPSPLSPGITGSAYAKLVDSAGDNIVLPVGKKIAVVLNATTADGSTLTEPTTVRVR